MKHIDFNTLKLDPAKMLANAPKNRSERRKAKPSRKTTLKIAQIIRDQKLDNG